MNVFMDTFAFIAWSNPRDAAYSQVSEYMESFVGRIIMTEWVLMELADARSKSTVRQELVQFIRRIRTAPFIEIIPFDRPVYDRGFDLFAARPDKDWSLTDCISFAVMTQRGLTEALTADHHFEQAGFRAIFA